MTMLIVCPRCASCYLVDPASLGSDGRSVRCARCKNVWFASRTTVKAPEAVRAFVGDAIAGAEAKSLTARAPSPSMAEPAAELPPADPAPAQEEKPPVAADEPATEAPTPVPAPNAGPAAEEPSAVIADAPSLVPPIEHEPLPEPPAAESEDAESYAIRPARLAARRKPKRQWSKWMALILALFAVSAAMIGAHNDVVRMAPQTAPLFAAIGLPVNPR